ncbi:hypothetical protein Bra471DRAFT_01343 [Bradyrhizobium sp. WSM471]|nr:hypothetical protein Bra471DRAFT_01343 [Bradyrhizobium sp. WSM471]
MLVSAQSGKHASRRHQLAHFAQEGDDGSAARQRLGRASKERLRLSAIGPIIEKRVTRQREDAHGMKKASLPVCPVASIMMLECGVISGQRHCCGKNAKVSRSAVDRSTECSSQCRNGAIPRDVRVHRQKLRCRVPQRVLGQGLAWCFTPFGRSAGLHEHFGPTLAYQRKVSCDIRGRARGDPRRAHGCGVIHQATPPFLGHPLGPLAGELSAEG